MPAGQRRSPDHSSAHPVRALEDVRRLKEAAIAMEKQLLELAFECPAGADEDLAKLAA